MLVLIATDQLRTSRPGSTPDDHHGAVDGELVTPVVMECADPHCDRCTRAWIGLVSHGDTTTAMIVDRPGVTVADLKRRIHDWLECGGWIDIVMDAAEAGVYEVEGVRVDDPVAAVAELVEAHIREIRLVCASFPVGTVVSRLGSLVAPRHLAQAA